MSVRFIFNLICSKYIFMISGQVLQSVVIHKVIWQRLTFAYIFFSPQYLSFLAYFYIYDVLAKEPKNYCKFTNRFILGVWWMLCIQKDLAPEQLTLKKAGCSSAVYGKADVFLSFKIFNELSVTRNTHWRLYLQDHEHLSSPQWAPGPVSQ